MAKILPVFALFVSFHFAFAQEWGRMPNAPSVQGRFDDIYFINDTIGWAVNELGEVYKTNGVDKPWQVQLYTGRYLRSVEFIDDTTGFVGSIDSAFYMTTNAGQDWTRIDKTNSFNVPGICGISHLGNSVILVGAYFGAPFVIRSADRGKTWNYKDMSDLAGGLVDVWYKSPDTIFVSGTNQDQRAIILRSADAGITWTNQTPQTPSSRVGYGWKLHFPTPSVGYVAIEEFETSNDTHFYKSVDGGRSWVIHNANIGVNINLQGLGFATANRGWIGGWSTGMYETKDGGMSWRKINYDFSNLNRFFFLRKDFGYVSGTSIFRFGEGTITATEPSEASHDVHSLEIYPNPASSETRAKVSLGRRTLVSLKLVDMNGRTIKQMFKGYAEAGIYSYPIEMENLPDGEYLVLLLTHEHFRAKKLVKAKE